MSSMWSTRVMTGFEPHDVYEDQHGNEDDSQAQTATLHVIASVRMVFSTMPFKTSSVRGHSPPLLQALLWVVITHIQPFHGIAV